MPETVLIRLVPPTLPVGFCPSTEQARATAYFELAQAQLLVSGAVAFYNYGDTTPAPENRIWPWFRTIMGAPDNWYSFSNGYWLTQYTRAPAGPNGLREFYLDSEASLLTYDGGEGAPATLYGGPFWEADHTMDGRIPMGAGAIPAADPAKTLNIAETYGAASHLLAASEVAGHTHNVVFNSQPDGVYTHWSFDSASPDGNTFEPMGAGGPGTNPDSMIAQTNNTAQTAMSLIPPVIGGLWIKRTIRRYIRVNP